MATPSSISNLNPRSLTLGFIIVAILVFVVSVISILFFSYRESQRLLQYELQIILRGNGAIIQSGNLRGFVDKIPYEKEGFYIETLDESNRTTFKFGKTPEYRINQCSTENYFQYNITFCRPLSFPWSFIFLLLVTLVITCFLFLASLHKLNKLVVMEFKELFKIASIPYNGELNFSKAWKLAQQMAFLFKKFQLDSIENERNKVAIEMAKQVSHDIRSPLSALTLMTNQLAQLPEENRVIIRSAVNRISDIANQLLQKSKELATLPTNSKETLLGSGSLAEDEVFPQLIAHLVDSIVSEKRIQFREKQAVEIEADTDQGYGLFAKLEVIELKRVISNLVNNSVEALQNESGKILVAVRAYKDFAAIMVQDNGKGIPESIIGKLGEIGVTHGKNETSSGSGLGIYHAKKTVERAGGQFQIQSRVNEGTIVTLVFKRVPAPQWFVEKLITRSEMTIVSLDDDISIHQIWSGRFGTEQLKKIGLGHKMFTSGSEFRRWVLSDREQNKNYKLKSERLFLVDFELLNQGASGLDLIEELGIGEQAILITSRYEEGPIRRRCELLGVKLIPKSMAGRVPISL